MFRQKNGTISPKKIFLKKSTEFDALYRTNSKSYYKTDYSIVKSNHFYTTT